MKKNNKEIFKSKECTTFCFITSSPNKGTAGITHQQGLQQNSAGGWGHTLWFRQVQRGSTGSTAGRESGCGGPCLCMSDPSTCHSGRMEPKSLGEKEDTNLRSTKI